MNWGHFIQPQMVNILSRIRIRGIKVAHILHLNHRALVSLLCVVTCQGIPPFLVADAINLSHINLNDAWELLMVVLVISLRIKQERTV